MDGIIDWLSIIYLSIYHHTIDDWPSSELWILPGNQLYQQLNDGDYVSSQQNGGN